MFANLKRHILAGVVMVSGLFGSSAMAGAQDYLRSFTLINRSSYTIRRLYLSPTSLGIWGYDRLGSNVLNPGYKVTVQIEPGYYDMKLVDEDGDSCVVSDIDFRNSDYLVLNNANLLACELRH